MFGGGVGGAQLLPDDLLDLSEGGAGDDDLGLGPRVSIHQRTARAAAQSLPEELQPTTETRRLVAHEGAEELFLLGVGRP